MMDQYDTSPCSCMARDALLIAVEQVVLIGLELVKLRLLFGDEQIVLTDLLVQILDLLRVSSIS